MMFGLPGIAAIYSRSWPYPIEVSQKDVVFRGDAAFAKPELYEALEERTVKYAIRLPANDNLQRTITELLTRPVGRPSHKPWWGTKAFSIRRRVGR